MKEAVKTRIHKVLPAKRSLRYMAASTLVNTFGNGLFITIEVIFLTRSVGLTPHQVGFGFTIAAAVALPMSVPAGHLADRLRIRNWVAGSQIIQGIAAASFIFIHSYWVFLFLAILVQVVGSGTGTLRMTLITRLSGEGEERVRFRAYLRAVTNLGIGAGASFAGIALAIDTRAAYATLVVLNGITFIAAALIFLKLPDTPVTATGNDAAASAFASFAAGQGARGAGGFAGGAGAAGGFAGGFGGAPVAAGQIKLIDGTNIYVTTETGSIVKVTTDNTTSLRKTATLTINQLKIGDTVSVSGQAGADGTVTATAINVGALPGVTGGGGSTPSATPVP